MSFLTHAAWKNNPAWVQLLGLCPLLAVSNSLANALALAFASALVLIGSNTLISATRRIIPDYARLPVFVLVIATFTTCATLIMQAFAYELYLQVALFVQIIVTNCMILARAESFASRNRLWPSLLDAIGTALGFAIALVVLGAVREVLGSGSLGAGVFSRDGLVLADTPMLIAALPPGAFIIAGLLLAFGRAISGAIGNQQPSLNRQTSSNREP